MVNQQWKIALALIFCPVSVAIIYFGVILPFKNLTDWLVIVSAFAMVAITLASIFYIVFKWLTVECEVTGFYDKAWASIFAYIVIFLLAVVVVIEILLSDILPRWKSLVLFGFSFPYLTNYYAAIKNPTR